MILKSDFVTIVARLAQFSGSQPGLVLKPLQIGSKRAIFGCYVPTIPRPTSLVCGRIFVRRLGENQTEIRLDGFQDWDGEFIRSLLESLPERADPLPKTGSQALE